MIGNTLRLFFLCSIFLLFWNQTNCGEHEFYVNNVGEQRRRFHGSTSVNFYPKKTKKRYSSPFLVPSRKSKKRFYKLKKIQIQQKKEDTDNFIFPTHDIQNKEGDNSNHNPWFIYPLYCQIKEKQQSDKSVNKKCVHKKKKKNFQRRAKEDLHDTYCETFQLIKELKELINKIEHQQ